MSLMVVNLAVSRIMAIAAVVILLAACATSPKKDLALERVKAQLQELQANEELAGYAPLALGEAKRALRQAETASGDKTYRIHMIYMADRRIQIARATAQNEQMEDEFNRLEDERSAMLVRASKLEATQARLEAEQARMISAARAEDANRAREEAQQASSREEESARNAHQAREEAEAAKALAVSSATAAELSRKEADLATEQADSLRRQLENLQLRQTESGVVVTLGDVLFESGQSGLREEAQSSLVEVVDLLQSQPDHKIRIEGHRRDPAIGCKTRCSSGYGHRAKQQTGYLGIGGRNLQTFRNEYTGGHGRDRRIAAGEAYRQSTGGRRLTETGR